jgi:hypothetical protein
MTITPTSLSRAAAVAAVLAGLVFIGVQINHPHLDATAVTTTEWAVRNSLKVLMAVLALTGITGMYLRQIRQIGVLGLVGYVLFALGYLTIMCIAFVAAYVLPSIADSDPSYVNNVLAVAEGGAATGDIGLIRTALLVEGLGYLAGGLVFGIALYRARVLARWAAALLAIASVLSATLPLLPDSVYRLLAFPNGLALIGLGYSLWRVSRTGTTPPPASVPSPLVASAGAE